MLSEQIDGIFCGFRIEIFIFLSLGAKVFSSAGCASKLRTGAFGGTEESEQRVVRETSGRGNRIFHRFYPIKSFVSYTIAT
jgi:hypothetical protein